MPHVPYPTHQTGDSLVDADEKVFPIVNAEPGEKALVVFHTAAFEGSIARTNLQQSICLLHKGFKTSILLYGPGVVLGVQRGYPTLGDEAFPGHQHYTHQIRQFLSDGGKVYSCRLALQAIGLGEPALIPGIRPIHPLDVLDIMLLHRKEKALILQTWTR